MHLVVTVGPDQGRTIPLPKSGEISLGRGTELPHPLSDPHASRKHCLMEIGDGVISVTDSGSRGGTFVNGSQIKSVVLKAGDTIRIGETELLYYADEHGDQTTLSPAARAAQSARATDDLSVLIGTTIYNYRLERIISHGKSGAVFYARHTKHDRDLAVKVLYPSITQAEEETQRFVRAMKTMFPIKHPNIVQIYNAGIQQPYCWVGMEYVAGEAMSEIIRRVGVAGMLPWDYAYRIAVQIARALECAATHNIIHRNLSPQNILIRKTDQVAKLGDLILAKATEGMYAEQITKPGELIGDVAYMAPGATAGTQGIDARADIYGLGATLYAVLTGRPPFEDPSLPSLISKIRLEEPPKPKTFQLGINDMFQGIVMQCLAKRPEDRYQSATALLQDLNRLTKFAGVSA